jgi:hypothetical protein
MPSLKSSALPLLVVLLFGYSLEYLQSKDVQITDLVSQRYILLGGLSASKAGPDGFRLSVKQSPK